jgi:cytochrome c6
MKKTILASIITLALSVPVLADDAAVAANYTKHCASCHGKDGKGQTTMGKKVGAKDFSDAKTWEGAKDEVALKNLKEGVKKDGKEIKKPFAGKLTEDEMKALLAYSKKFKK